MTCYHRLEREKIHLLLLDDARRGLEDIAVGRAFEADAALAQLQQRRSSNHTQPVPLQIGNCISR